MLFTIDSLTQLQQKNMRAALQIQQKMFSGVEKMADTQIKATRAHFELLDEQITALSHVKDPQGLLNFSAALVQPLIQNHMNYVQETLKIRTNTLNDLLQAGESATQQATEAFSGVLETLDKNAPAGSAPVVSAIKTALATGQTALQTLTSVGKQAAQFADTNTQAAVAATVKTVTGAADSVNQFAKNTADAAANSAANVANAAANSAANAAQSNKRNNNSH
jgi:hypothetical protein